jgi:uncharacterized delta-60 repeat protein
VPVFTLEPVEQRILFSNTLVTGPATVVQGATYTLSLNAAVQAGANWSFNWGDGTTSTAPGTATTATHTFANGPATDTVTATVSGLANPIDTSFGPNHTGKVTTDLGSGSDYGYRTLVQPDGKILLAGGANFSVTRYNTNGTLDTTFGSGGIVTQSGTDVAYGAALQPDGKILVGGGSNFGLARLNADGSLDTSFGTGGKTVGGFGTTYVGYDLALLPSGKVLMVGKNGNDFVAARFNANGSVDTTFGTNGKVTTDVAGSYDKGFCLAVQSDGTFFVAGQSRIGTTNYNGSIAKYTANGALDTTFGTGGKVTTDFGNNDDAVWALSIQPNGQILAAGSGGTSTTGYDFALARYNANGSLDTSFGGNGTGFRLTDFGHGGDQAFGMSVLSTGQILLVGRAESSSNALDFALARYNADGTLDTTFGTGGKVTTDFAGSSDYGETVAVQSDGDVIVAGASSTVGSNGATDFALARYVMTGSTTTTSGSTTTTVNGVATGSVTVAVTAAAPTVSITGAATVAEGSAYTLGLSAQESGSRAVSSWTIAWGDGSTQVVPGNPSSVSHVYANAAASRTISASATDSAGTYAASSTVTVAVTNVAPTVAWSGVTSMTAGSTFRRQIATFTDPGFSSAETYSATINWGDGAPTDAGTVAVTPGAAGRATAGTVSGQHTYGSAGTYTVTVTVADANGGSTTITQAVSASLPPQPYLIPGLPGSSTTVSFTITNNVFSALYRNELGCYLVDDANYDVGPLGPKSAGYATAAVGGPSSRVVFPRGAAVGTTVSLVLPAGKLLAFYMVQDATTADFLNGTFPADFGRAAHLLEYKDRPNVFFLTADANFDHFQHVRLTQVGSNPPVYGFEDLTGGGDQDFNDLVFSVGATPAPTLTAKPDDAAGKIDLSWTDVPGERNGFQVYRGTSTAGLRPIGTTGKGMTTFSDYGAVAGQPYFYAVAAFANDMQPSAVSAPVQATLRAGAGTGPAVATTPSSLAYVGGTGPATVDGGVTVADGSGHQIVGATVTVAGDASGTVALALPAGGPSGITAVWSASTGVLTLSGTASVADYQAALRTVTLAAAAAASDVVTFAVTDDALYNAHASRTVDVSGAPTATATADEAASAIDLSWTAVPGATAYQVYRGTSAGTLTAYGAPVQIAPPYSDSGVSRGATYYYAVASISNGQVGTASQPVHATLQPAGGPAVTTSVDPVSYLGGGTAVAVDGGLAVSDSAGRQLLGATVSVDNDADGSVVLDLPPGGPAGITASWSAGTLALSGTASVADYQAALRTVTLSAGATTATHLITFTVTDAAPLSAQASRAVNVYGPPTLAARPDLAAEAIDLTWNEVAGENGFEVYRGTSPSSLAPYAARSQGVTSYADTGAVAGTAYYYAVAALGADGLPAAQSSPPVAATLPLPVAGGPVMTNTAGALSYVGGSDPVAIDGGLTLTDGGSSQLVGASVWVGNDRDGSDVLALPTARRPAGITAVWAAGTLTLSGTASAADYQAALRLVTFWGTTAAPQSVGFSVTDAAGLVGQGARTVNVSGPPTLTASADSPAGTIDLGWATVAGGQGFQLYRGTSTGGLLPYRTFGATTVAYADPNVVTGTTYYYAVAATGPDGAAGLRSVMVNATLPIPVTTGPSVTTTGTTLAYLDGAPAIAADGGVTLSDGAGISITGAAVRVTEDAAGSLALALPPGGPAGITASWSESNGVLTLSGTASVADYQSALRSVTFAATVAGPQVVTFTVTDSTSAIAQGDRSVSVAGPTTVTATADEAATAIDLSWTPVAGASSYQVYRGTIAGGTLAAYGSPVQLTVVPYSDANVDRGTTYYYAVAALDANNNPAAQSLPAGAALRATVGGGPVVTTTAGALTYVGGSSAVAVDGGATVVDGGGRLIAGATATIADDADGPYALSLPAGASPAISSSWDPSAGVLTLSGTASAADYQSALRLMTFVGTGAGSKDVTFDVTDVSALTGQGDRTVSVSGPPTVTATPDDADGTIGLSWTAVAGATDYQVYRGTVAGGLLTAYGPPVQLTPAYSDPSATRGVTYYYAVAAKAADGSEGTLSAAVDATLSPVVTGGLSTPVLSAGADVTTGVIHLAWSDPDTTLTGFRVERATDAAFTQGLVAWQVPEQPLSYDDGTGSQDTLYYYRVSALAGTAVGPASNAVPAELAQDMLTITSAPAGTYTLPAQSHSALGGVTAGTDDDVTHSVEFQQIQGEVQQQVNVAVPDADGRQKVDLFLLLDDTGSMAETGPEIAQQLPSIIENLRQEYPNVDFGVGVGRMAEYDHEDEAIFGEFPQQESPFILDQPILALGPTDFADPLRAENDPSPVERAILDALNRAPRPVSGDGRVAAIEALYQLATGKGFDQDGDYSTTTDGVAGSATVEDDVKNGWVRDVPAFDTFDATSRANVAPTVISTTSGVAVDGVVATFRADGLDPTKFNAIVTWYDDAVDPGATGTTDTSSNGGGTVTITRDANGLYAVHAPHAAFAVPGTYAIRVEVDPPLGTPVSVASRVVVAAAGSAAVPALTVMAPVVQTGTAFTGAVAHFDAPASQVGAYAAVIDWGDGQKQSATYADGGIVPAADGGYDVVATHLYGQDIAISDRASFGVRLADGQGGGNVASLPLVVSTPGSAVLPPSGTLGGAGFRSGAVPIILMATDAPLMVDLPAPSVQYIVGNPGNSGTVKVPVSAFSAGLSYNLPEYVDGQPVLVPSTAGPSSPQGDIADNGNQAWSATTPFADIQQLVYALNALGAKVIGLGANGAHDTYPDLKSNAGSYPELGVKKDAQDPNGVDDPDAVANADTPVPSDQAPRSYMEALAELTGAYNATGATIENGDGSGDPLAPGDPLYFRITPDAATTVANGVQSAIGAVLASASYNVTASAASASVSVTSAAGDVNGVAAGSTASFELSLTANATSASTDILFTDPSTGRLYGSLPVRVTAPYTYDLTASDSRGLPVTYTLVQAAAPAGDDDQVVDARIDGSQLTWNATTVGTYTFTVQASDGTLQAYQTFSVTVDEAASTNHDPVVTPVPDQAAVVAQPLSFTISAGDADGDQLTYYLFDAPAGMTINTASGQVDWTPQRDQVGAYQVTAVVIDGNGGRALSTFNVTAATTNGANHAPVFVSGQPGVAPVGDLYGFAVRATDPDGDPIEYRLGTDGNGATATLPAGMRFDATSGTFAWTPGADQVGDYSVPVEAVDSRGAVTRTDLTFHVGAAPATPRDLIASIDQGSAADSFTGQDGNTVQDGTPVPHVWVTWLANTETDLAGYNVYYYASSTGGPEHLVKLNTTLLGTGTTTLDVTPLLPIDLQGSVEVEGTSFGLAVTAVNTEGLESPATVPVSPWNGESLFKTISATVTDPTHVGLAATATGGNAYAWSVASVPAGVNPTAVTFADNGNAAAISTSAIVPAAGTYTFECVIAGSPDASRTVTVVVPAVVTQVIVSPAMRSVTAGSSVDLSAGQVTVLDQFGAVLSSSPAAAWQMVTNASGATVQANGAFSAGSGSGVDVVRVNAGAATGYQWIAVGNVAAGTICAVGLTAGGIEGVDTGWVPLASFIDTSGGHAAGDFTATVDWGDSSQSDAQVVQRNGIFQVLGHHAYVRDSVGAPYAVQVQISCADGATATCTAQLNVLDAPATVLTNPTAIVAATGSASQLTFVDVIDDNPLIDDATLQSTFNAFFSWDGGATWQAATKQTNTAVDGTDVLSFGDNSLRQMPASFYDVQVMVRKDGNASDPTSGRLLRSVTVPVQLYSNGLVMPDGAWLNATVVASDTVELQLNDGYGPDWKIARIDLTAGDTWTSALATSTSYGWLQPGDAYTKSNPFFDTGLVPGHTYQYEIFRTDSNLDISNGVYSTPVTTWSDDPAPPDVTGLSATEQADKAADGGLATPGVQLLWDPPADGTDVVGYDVLREDATGWHSVLPAGGGFIDPSGPLVNGQVGYFDATATFPDGTDSYDYEVQAISSHGQRSPGIVVTAVRDAVPPTTPTNVAAASYPAAIQLTWDDRPQSDDGDWAGWNVYRYDAAAGQWVKLNQQLITNETGYDDYDAPVGVVSRYRVTSVDLLGLESAPAEVDERRSVHGAPPSPGSLTALPVVLGSGSAPAPGIRLAWSAVVPTLDQGHAGDALASYQVYRSTTPSFVPTDGPGGNLLATITSDDGEPPATTYDDATVSASTTYYYAVLAVDGDGDESNPAVATARSGSGHTLAGDLALMASDIGTASALLSWQSVPTAIGYQVYRSQAGADGPFALVSGPSLVTNLDYLDATLRPNADFYYRVYAVDALGDCSNPPGTTHVKTTNVAGGPPIVVIQSPTSSDANGVLVVSADLPVHGIVEDLNNDLASWQLVLRPYDLSADDASQDIVVARGTSQEGELPGTSALLGTIRPEAVANGLYRLILTATDEQGNGANPAELSGAVQVQSQLKLGNLTLPITDLTVNVPNGQPVSATRTYDSSNANVAGVMGYGWQLNLTNTQLKTTASGGPTGNAFKDGDDVYVTTPDGQQYTFAFIAQANGDTTSALAGGLVESAATYTPQFICVDGSGATLTVPGDSDGDPFLLYRQSGGYYADEGGNGYNPTNYGFGSRYTLKTADGTSYVLDSTNGQLVSATAPNGQAINYGAISVNYTYYGHSVASLTDSDGRKVQYAYDSAGNLIGTLDPTLTKTTYVYGDQLIVPYDGSATLNAVITRTSDGDVWNAATNAFEAYSAADAAAGNYGIALGGQKVADGTGDVHWYTATGPAIAAGTGVRIAYYAASNATAVWTDTRTWAAPHQLVAIIDSRGVEALSATYDPGSGLLASLVNTNKQAAPVRTGGFNGTTGSQAVVDPAGDQTEDVYDAHGNVTREIKTVTDASGAVTGYLVTVTAYNYWGPQDGWDVAAVGATQVNMLLGTTTYGPFLVAANAKALAYTQAPAGPALQVTNYKFSYEQGSVEGSRAEVADPAYGKPTQTLSYVGPYAGGAGQFLYRMTSFGGYDKLGHARVVAQSLVVLDANGQPVALADTALDANGQHVLENLSATGSTYDAAGNLTSSTDASGQTTYYWYTREAGSTDQTPDPFAGTAQAVDTSNYDPNLLVYTYRVDAAGSKVLLSSTAYYTGTTWGQVNDLPSATTTYNYEVQGGVTVALPQTTYSVYDQTGNVLLSYTYKAWSAADGTTVHGWVASGTDYDMAGRSTSTWQATYLDSNPNADGSAHTMDLSVSGYTEPDGSSAGSTGSVSVNEPLYGMSAAQVTGSTTYTPDGQTATTTDVYGRPTTNTYNASGQLVRTINADGTQTRSVYDSLGRVVWQTDVYVTTSADDNTTTALATHTVYNSLGQVVATYRVSGVLITIGADPMAGGAAGLEATTLANSGMVYSAAQTWYDDQGRTIETKDAAGLRRATVYNPDGSVAATGVLATSAPDGGHAVTVGGVMTIGYTTADFVVDPATGRVEYTSTLSDQLDTSTGQPWSGMTYSVTTVNDGVSATGTPAATSTRTYQSADGRISFTVYADGSYTETIASAGDQAIAGYQYETADGVWHTPVIPAGGSETITVAQHMYGDGNVPFNIDVSDASGNLVDVYEPAVTDGDPSSPTYGLSISPHTHYGYDASGNEVLQVSADEQAAYAAWLAGPQTAPFTGGTTWTYDAFGHELTRTLPDGESESYTYDAYGNVHTHVDFDGNVATSMYEPATLPGTTTPNPKAGELDGVTYVDPTGHKAEQDVSYTYDGLGRQATLTDSADANAADPTGTTTETYDDYGNLKEEQTPEGTIWHVYEPATGRLTDTYTDYTETSCGYNTQGQLWTVTVRTRATPTGTWSAPAVMTYTYDGQGNKQTETLPNGDKTTYTYDDLNRLTLETITHGTTLMETLDYDQALVTGTKDATLMLRSDGNRGGMVDTTYDSNGTTVTSTKTFRWDYDEDGRLKSEALTASDSTLDYSDTYSYDLNGNRTKDVRTGSNPLLGPAGTTVNTYNGDDQLQTAVFTPAAGTTGASTTTYGYDANGSQLTATTTTVNPDLSTTTTTTAYAFDVRNKMVTVKQDGTTKATYVYDDAGDRVGETTGATATYYLTDNTNPTGYAQPIEERSSPTAAPTVTYLIGDHVFGQVNATGAPTYFLVDGHGSTVAFTDATGATMKTLAYTAYGDALNFSTVTVGTAYLFSGDGPYDVASGLYLRGDGIRGGIDDRFVEEDTEGHGDKSDPISLHRYLYAGSSPTLYVDPSGHDLVETLSEIGIDTGLNLAVNHVIRNASVYVGGALLSALPIALATAGAPSAWIFSAGLSGDFPLPTFGLGVSAGLTYDRVASIAGSSSASYISLNGQFSTPRPPSSFSSFGIPITLGVAWGLHDSGQYSGAALGVSVPFKSLPNNLQSKLFAGLSNLVADGGDVSEMISSFNFPDLPDFAKDLGPGLEGQVAGFSAKLLSFLDRLEVTAVTDSSLDYIALEITANSNFSVAAGDSADGPATRLSVNLGYAKQISPSGPVAF